MRASRPLVASAVVATFLVAALASAVVFLGPPKVRLSDEPTAADAVTLYQSGLAFVELSRTFASSGGDALLSFAVPTSAIFESIEVDGPGVVVKEVRSALAADPLLSPGDAAVVHVEGGATYAGTVLSFEGGQLLLSTTAGAVAVVTDRIEAIEMPGKAADVAAPGAAEVTALVEAPAGSRTVELRYLARGPGWVPAYSFELATRALRFEASLSGLADWANVSLDLVSGSPNIVASYPGPLVAEDRFYASRAAAADSAGAPASGFGPSTALGDLHRYHLSRPVTLARGESVRLPVLAGQLEVLRHYYSLEASTGWGGPIGSSQAGEVLERAELRNALAEPLPAGVVRFYEDKTWIGEDMLPSLPRGERGNVTLARAEEVTAKLILEQQSAAPGRDTWRYRLVVENDKSEAIDLRATLTYPAYRTNLLDAAPKPAETLGGRVVWNVAELGAGQSATFVLSYETLRDY